MTCKLRRIHTLYRSDTITEITGMCSKQSVFKYIGSFSQVAEKEIGTGIFGAFIITKTTLLFITTQYIDRFKS